MTQSPLHLATYLNLINVVKSLVGKGASLELQDQDGNTALHVACQHGQTECADEMTRDVSLSKLVPVLETQNWRGEVKRLKCCRSSPANNLLVLFRVIFIHLCDYLSVGSAETKLPR